MPQVASRLAARLSELSHAQLTIEHEQCATNTRGNLFGTANSAAAIHGINPSNNHPLTPAFITGQNSMLDQLDSQLDNMVMAATNEKILAQLAANNTKLTALTSVQ